MKPDFLRRPLSLPLQLHCLLDVRTICCIQHAKHPPPPSNEVPYSLLLLKSKRSSRIVRKNRPFNLFNVLKWRQRRADGRVMGEGGQAEEAGASFGVRQEDRSGPTSAVPPSRSDTDSFSEVPEVLPFRECSSTLTSQAGATRL